MRYSRRQSSYSDFGASFRMTKTVKILILINVFSFVLMHVFPRVGWFSLLGLVPRYVFSKFMIWQLATYLFVHSGLWHLIINMLMLWFFGPAIEQAWGKKQFLIYYFFTGIAAALCSFVTSPHSLIPVVGASGAIFGILVAYALMFPETTVLFLFIFPMKIRYAVFILAAINLLGALSEPGSEIAYFAHLGGGVFGYLYLKSEHLRRYLSSGFYRLRSHQQIKKDKESEKQQSKLNQQVDHILDKVSRYGIESLTKEEKKILERKSKEI